MATPKPRAHDNSWLGVVTGGVLLQVQNLETQRWETIGRCVDAPNAIAKELRKAKYKGQSVWVRDCLGERTYRGLVR